GTTVFSLLSLLLAYGIAALLFGYPIAIAEPGWFAISLLFAVAALWATGMFFTPLAILWRAVGHFLLGLEYPIFALSGLLFPLLLLPGWTAPISNILPPYWAAVAMHGAARGDLDLPGLLRAWCFLFLTGGALLLIAKLLFERVLTRARRAGTLALSYCGSSPSPPTTRSARSSIRSSQCRISSIACFFPSHSSPSSRSSERTVGVSHFRSISWETRSVPRRRPHSGSRRPLGTSGSRGRSRISSRRRHRAFPFSSAARHSTSPTGCSIWSRRWRSRSLRSVSASPLRESSASCPRCSSRRSRSAASGFFSAPSPTSFSIPQSLRTSRCSSSFS